MEHLPNPIGATVDASCDEHGPFVSRQIVGRIWSRCPVCEEARRAAEQAAEANAARVQAEARQRKLLGRAAIPERFIGRTFETFKADTDDKRRALSVLRDYSDNFDANARNGKGLILSGKPGTGKSHLAISIARACIRGGARGRFYNVVDLVNRLDGEARAGRQGRMADYLSRLDFVILDELGYLPFAQAGGQLLFHLVSRLYELSLIHI